MVPSILVAILFATLVLLAQKSAKQAKELEIKKDGYGAPYKYDLFYICVAAILGLFLGGLIAFVLGASQESVYKPTSTIYLQNISTPSNIGGRFFLGIGYIRSTRVYSYRYFNQDGSSAGDYVDYYSSYNTVFSDDPVEKPYLEIWTPHSAYPDSFFIKYFTFGGPSGQQQNKFHIPPESIQSDYKIE